jgi:hypothetical protein
MGSQLRIGCQSFVAISRAAPVNSFFFMGLVMLGCGT